jgi:hypothetical protein
MHVNIRKDVLCVHGPILQLITGRSKQLIQPPQKNRSGDARQIPIVWTRILNTTHVLNVLVKFRLAPAEGVCSTSSRTNMLHNTPRLHITSLTDKHGKAAAAGGEAESVSDGLTSALPLAARSPHPPRVGPTGKQLPTACKRYVCCDMSKPRCLHEAIKTTARWSNATCAHMSHDRPTNQPTSHPTNHPTDTKHRACTN